MPDSYNATVSAVEPLTPGVVQLTLAVDQRFSFAPGQSVVIHFPSCERTYCIASAPERLSAIQLCIRLGSGEGSEAVRGLVTGSSLSIDGPVGDFVMPDDEVRDVRRFAALVAPLESPVSHSTSATNPGECLRVVRPVETEQARAWPVRCPAATGLCRRGYLAIQRRHS